MKCPVCSDATLVMSDRQGIEIDYCPQCRGVWLDRGELDKIIERTAPEAAAPQPPPAPSRMPPPQQHQHQHHGHSSHSYDQYRRKKPKSLLGELFDF